MPELYAVTCPHCNASGQLSDPGLKGTAIYCPVCSRQFVIPAAPATPVPTFAFGAPVATPAPVPPAAPVAAIPIPAATPVAAPVAQPVIATAAPSFPAAMPVAATATPVVAVPAAQPMPSLQPTGDFPQIGTPPANNIPSTSSPAYEPAGQRPSAPKSRVAGLLKVAFYSCISAFLIFGVLTITQKPAPRKPAPAVASTKKKAKKSSRRKTGTAAPKETPVASDEMPAEEEESKLTEPKIEIASTTPARPKPKMAKPAAPAAPTPPAKPVPNTPPQTIENIPPEVRTAIDAAVEKKDLPALVAFLGNPHAGVRLTVAQQLSSFEPFPAAAPALVERLQEPDAEARKAAAKALAKHGASLPAVIPALGTVVRQDKSWEVRATAAASLAALALGNPERSASAAAVLVPALETSYGEELPALIVATGSLGESGKLAIPTLVKILAHPQLAEDAVFALAQLGNFESFPPIIAGKSDVQLQQKRRMAEGLGLLRPMSKPALAIIQTLSTDADESVRISAVDALKNAEPKLPEALPLLEKALADSAAKVQESAKNAIASYQSADPAYKVKVLLTQLQKEEKAVWKYSQIGEALLATKEEGFNTIVQIAADPKSPPELRESAGQVLALSWSSNWHNIKSTDELKTLFNSPDLSLTIRTGCAVALMKLSVTDPRLGATLLDAVRDNTVDFQVREAAVAMAPNDQENFLSTLTTAIGPCEAAVPEGTSDLERQKRAHFYAGLLAAMKGLKPESRAVVMPHLVTAIRQADGTVKIAALETIHAFGDASPEVVEATRETLKHERPEVRLMALKTIGSLQKVAAAALPDLREALKAEDPEWRIKAAATLGEFGPAAAEAAPEILALMADEKTKSAEVLQALARIAPEAENVVAAFTQALGQPMLRAELIDVLQKLGPQARGTLPVLRKILPGSEKEFRKQILRVISQLGEDAKPALPEIVQLLADADAETRESAVSTLGQLKRHAAEAVPELVKLLGDKEEAVQEETLQALGRIGRAGKAAVPDVEKFLADTKSESLKEKATQTLTSLTADPGDADPALFDLLLDEDEWDTLLTDVNEQKEKLQLNASAFAKLALNKNATIRTRALFILAKLRSRPAGRLQLEQLLNGADLQGRAMAAVLLQRVPTEGDRAELAQALLPFVEVGYKSNQASSPDDALQVMMQLGSVAVPLIAATLTNEKLDHFDRDYFLDIIQRPPGVELKSLLPLLRETLKSEIPERKYAAAIALARLNPREAEVLPQLLECLASPDIKLKEKATLALIMMSEAEVDVSAAIPSLMKDLPNKELKLTTAAVAQIGAREEDVPQLREMLAKALAAIPATGEVPDLNPLGALIILLSTVEPSAPAALPEFKAFVERGLDQLSNTPIDVCLAKIGEPAIQMLNEVAERSDVSPAGRKLAISLLEKLAEKEERTTATLVKLLKDKETPVRAAAALILARQPATVEAAVPVLRELMFLKPDAGVTDTQHVDILHELRTSKPHSLAAVPDLIRLTRDATQDDDQRDLAAYVMLEIAPESPEARAAYVECIQTLREDVAVIMLRQPVKLPAADILTALTKSLEANTEPQRSRAIRLLGHLGAPAQPALPALRAIVAADAGAPGLDAALAVLRIDPTAKDMVPRLVDGLLTLKDEARRNEIRLALQQLGPNAAEALPKLLEAVQGPTPNYDALAVITTMGPAAKPVLPLFKKAITQTPPDFSMISGLARLGPDAAELGPDLLALMKKDHDAPNWPFGETIDVTISVLSKMGAPAAEAVEQLRKNLQDEVLRLESFKLLGKFGPAAAPAVPDLIKFASGDDAQFRLVAIETLSHIGPDAKEAAPMLATALADPDPRIAEAAANALVALKDQALPALPQVIAALEKPREKTKFQMVQLLRQFGPAAKEAVPVLTKLATNDLSIRLVVRDALEKIQAQ